MLITKLLLLVLRHLPGRTLQGQLAAVRPTGRPAVLAAWPLACTALVDLSLLLDGSVASSNL